MNSVKIKILITLYIILFIILTIFFTPYKQFVYSSGEVIFTGERGFCSLFSFNTLDRSRIGNAGPTTYHIDLQILLIELFALTVVFIGLYFITKNRKSPPQ